MITILSALVSLLSFRVPSRASLELELVALRHQVTILRRQRLGQLRLFSTDRPLWVWLYRVWPRSSTPCAPSSVTTKAAHVMHARLCCTLSQRQVALHQNTGDVAQVGDSVILLDRPHRKIPQDSRDTPQQIAKLNPRQAHQFSYRKHSHSFLHRLSAAPIAAL
jgi:hypothetical protein